ncbi:NlpC/P60 family protein [Corynebacterium glyciniphilum]|uniref:NlpC/P60 family protein n=1 Tax=Corynebacterium glyciniphilum TaxID=1404244 RepID=UPI0011AB361F|nr:NlpC/P60 family protein [Corynebacterium glyciniphilum]
MIRPSGHRSSTRGTSTRLVVGIGTAVALTVASTSVVAADPAAPAPADAVDTSPLPDDADGLLERLAEVSRQAQEVSDEVQENSRALDDTRAQLDRANRAAAHYSAEAQRARADVEANRGPVTELSQSLYRGAVIDPVSAMAGSANPQDAIDRRAFASALNADRTNTLSTFQDGLKEAADLESKANRSKASADFQLNQLEIRQGQLDERTRDLDGLKKDISTAVDGLSPDQKQRWVDRNGPIDVDVEEFLGKVAGAAGDAVSDAGGAVGAAMSKLGSPYSWGATGPDSFDCSGLMFWAYQQIGKSVPRTSSAQVAGGTSVSRGELQPGDIVGFYPGVTHVGMYIGDGKIVHASDYGIPVQVVSVDSMPFAGAARY